MGRGAGLCIGSADDFNVFVLDRGDHVLLLRIPPLVSQDAVPVAVGAGEERGMTGSRARIGVVVIAVGKVGAVIDQEAKASVAELVVIALEIISAKLIDDDDYDKLGVPRIGRGETVSRNCDEKNNREYESADSGSHRPGE